MASARHNYNTDIEGMTQAGESAMKTKLKMDSQNLLVAMLRSGQHSLEADRFWETVRGLRAMGVKL